ncbi:PREDICTED: beta-1,3-galactosyltransferase 5 [Gavialis gangeticus]|uniref:beta-1,3-galactosyltransferase 5 n=1 Tax=Gavialis gangeticus TaxID=94835 RepID=UPI00092F0A15|nr:PREDICTED: beta-1,3-galactosyltransferase 5 [Gavialis gangeticus]XP_019381079.1 PREDICTED: beta-1,3-galactosyltransferase 5 [Gavialis gangeticus]XP_019381080.1 PREDICTED: beta-1,3-galactosyltransferase 5 [Gavialis gangeticus]
MEKSGMAFKVSRIFICLIAVASFLCLCFYITLNWSDICILCPKGEVVLSLTHFKKDTEQFLQLPDIDCSKNPPFLVLLVTSSCDQKEARLAIRQTWGKERLIAGKRIITFFLLGTTEHQDEQTDVLVESQAYKDIIQKGFIDTYYNLTLKTMMGMEWVHKFCQQSSFVMKTDTDVFVNVFYLTELLLRKNKSSSFFTGFLKMNERPIRQVFSKWYVSKYEYPGSTYPPFCSGTGYVFSTDVASQVLNISGSVPFLKLEDVYIGLCLAKLQIKLEELNSKQTFFPIKLEFSLCGFVTCHFITPHEQRDYWSQLEKSVDNMPSCLT